MSPCQPAISAGILGVWNIFFDERFRANGFVSKKRIDGKKTSNFPEGRGKLLT